MSPRVLSISFKQLFGFLQKLSAGVKAWSYDLVNQSRAWEYLACLLRHLLLGPGSIFWENVSLFRKIILCQIIQHFWLKVQLFRNTERCPPIPTRGGGGWLCGVKMSTTVWLLLAHLWPLPSLCQWLSVEIFLVKVFSWSPTNGSHQSGSTRKKEIFGRLKDFLKFL